MVEGTPFESAVSEVQESSSIYLVISPRSDSRLVAWLEPVLDQGLVACLLLKSDHGSPIDPDLARHLIGIAHERETPVLLENNIDAAAELGADGVEIDADESAYQIARQRLGADAMVGARCGTSRHAAMVMAEAGADYVAFDGAQEELIGWWAEIFEVPCVASQVDTMEKARALAQRGADFIAIGDGFLGATTEAPFDAISTLHLSLSRARTAA